MAMKKTVGAVSAAFFGVVLSASAAGTFYDAELTNNWISAGLVPGLSTEGGAAVPLSGAEWRVPTDGEAMATNQTVVFDTDATDPLVYTPTGVASNTVLVNVNLMVEPNAAIPSTNGLDAAQAALTVVTNSTSQRLEWVGLIGSGATNAWVVLSGDNPVQGNEYDVQIALDNRTPGARRIRYAVKQSSAAAYTVLTNGVDVWLPNPKDLSVVSAVAFAGAGTVKSFSGDTIVNDGATIDSITAGRGYDFTNGTLTAVFTIPSGYLGKTAVLRVVDFVTGEATTYDAQTITGTGTLSDSLEWDLTSLTPGGTYSYTLSVKSGDNVRAVRAGSFVAANMSSDYWFCAKVVNGVPAITNGTWTTAPELDTDHWNVTSDALFEIDDISDGSNAVSRVDTVYSFQSSIDIESLDNLDEDAIGGLVAVSDGGGAWCAWTGSAWQLLSGGVVPEVATEYIVRAEFDFMSTTKRVRYSVGRNGSDLMPLSLSGSEWINLANQNTGALASVGMSGSGSVKSICANIADGAVVVDSLGNKFASIWDAIQNGTGPFTLLTNATLAPTDVTGKKKTFRIDKATFEMIINRSGLGKWRLIENGDGSYILMKPGATYIFL